MSFTQFALVFILLSSTFTLTGCNSSSNSGVPSISESSSSHLTNPQAIKNDINGNTSLQEVRGQTQETHERPKPKIDEGQTVSIESESYSLNQTNDSYLLKAITTLRYFATTSNFSPNNLISGGTKSVSYISAPYGLSSKEPRQFSWDWPDPSENEKPLAISKDGSPTSWLSDWYCYSSTPITVVVDETGMTIDGELTEYRPTMSERCEPKVPENVAHFRFEHAHINDKWQIDSGRVLDLRTHLALRPDQLLLESVEATIEDTFGRAWLEIWKQNLDNTQDPIFALENGKVRYTRFPKQAIDYRKLDKAKLMAGTVFGNYPGSDEPASNQWCQIMNIPTDYSKETLDAQTIIATNCGRSMKRYCDPYSGFLSGQRQAAPPLGWSNTAYQGAMANSLESKTRQQQGHWTGFTNMSQNTFTVTPSNMAPFKSMIKPIFGYTNPKNSDPDSPQFNNAGANSFFGHAGHCQSEMQNNGIHTGASSLPVTAKGVTGIDYITQNFMTW